MVTGDLHENEHGVRPLDDAFDRLHTDVTVTYHMLPVLQPQSSKPDGDKKQNDKKPQQQNVRTAPYNESDSPRNSRGKGGKGGGKSKGGRNRRPMPKGLIGMHSTTQDGRPICFNYNLGKCSKADCRRAHVCCVPNCYKQHPQIEHTRKTAANLSGKRARLEEADSSLHAAKESPETEWVPKPDECYCIEIFCGPAGLTSVVRSVFLGSFGVDHVVKRPKSKIVRLDLQDLRHQALLLEWVSDRRCIWVHFGVLCGAASRARDRPLSKKRRGPQPLRSQAFPNGLPPRMLKPDSLARLRAANRLYAFMEKVIN